MNGSSERTRRAMRWQSVEVCRSAACLRRTSGRGATPAPPASPTRRPGASSLDAVPRVTASGVKLRTGGRAVAAEAQRAVRVVLDDHEPVAVGQRGEVAAAIEGQRAARRVLEVGDDVAEAGPQAGGQARLQQIGPQAVPVGRDRHEVGSVPRQRLQGADVGRSLDHDVVAGVDERPGQQVEAPAASRW